MEKTWLKEVARDLLALGSIPFYFIVVIRAIIGKYNIFVYQMLIAALVIFILYFLIKDSNLHIARSFVTVVFTSLFYNELLYTSFAVLIWVLLVVAAYYIKINISNISKGIIIGLIGTIVGYYGASLL